MWVPGPSGRLLSRRTIRQNISLLVPIAVFLVVNIPPWFGFSYVLVVFQWATFQRPLTLGGDQIFPVTLASAIVTVVITSSLFIVQSKLSFARSLIQGFGLALAATALFEIIYQFAGYLFYPAIITGVLWPANYVLNGSWLFVAYTSRGQWRLSKRLAIVSIGFALSWVVWIGIGFPQLFQDQPTALVANAVTKVLSYALVISAIDFHERVGHDDLPSPA